MTDDERWAAMAAEMWAVMVEHGLFVVDRVETPWIGSDGRTRWIGADGRVRPDKMG